MQFNFTTFFLFSGLLKIWPDAENWPRLCNVSRDPMHGGAFNGNACRQLLKKADVLDYISPLIVKPFVEAFRAFNKVVESCFGEDLDPDYLDSIEGFKQKYMDLVQLGYVNVTPKIHCIFFHVQQFCDKNEGLGRYSEQASEAVHADFKRTLTRYHVGSSNDRYDEILFRAVMDYNCSHL